VHPHGCLDSAANGTFLPDAFARASGRTANENFLPNAFLSTFRQCCERGLSAKAARTAIVPVQTPTLETLFWTFYVFSRCFLAFS
jgi:hypothetical protein